MNTSGGTYLVNRFVQALNERGIKVVRTSISRNVFEFNGRSNSLLYIKGRSEQPLRWGVTANVIERLQSQTKPWAVILLFESYERGYFLSQQDVNYYIRDTWPLARDGDYKPSPGSYLSGNPPLYSIQDLIDSIEIMRTV
jgi:hypothetical protein